MGAAGAGTRDSSRAADAPHWWKVDLHVHTTTSGDALQDLGVMATAAKLKGFNAIFVTDHGAGSNAPIGGVIANHIRLEDDITQWKQATYGTTASTTDELVSSPVEAGTKSLHLAATSSGYGESFVWYKRGPNLHQGDIMLRFSVFPTRIDPRSAAYVSLAVGGDPMMAQESGGGGFLCDSSTAGKGYPPNGYTTRNGAIEPGHSVVFVWELGTARAASSVPTSRVVVTQLPYKLDQWNTFTIDVSKAIRALPAAEQPSSDDVLSELRLAAAANGGTADAYFDDYRLDATAPTSTGSEFVRRNREIEKFDTASFKLFPGLEAGLNGHTSRFNYDITKASQWMLYKHGPQAVKLTEQEGFPAQVDHPALPGGISEAVAVATHAEGADLIEAVPRGTNEVMLSVWDHVLETGTDVVGTWSSDSHRTEKLGPATYLYAPALTFDALMQAAYEGRAYMADAAFGGRVIFNLDEGSDAPYPARYPVYVPPNQQLAVVHLRITGGIPNGAKLVWVVNGTPEETDPVAGASLDVLHSVPLGRPFQYVRAELRGADNSVLAMTEPIFFRQAVLPTGATVSATGVENPGGNGYTHLVTRGIAAPSFAKATLSIPLRDRSGAAVSLNLTTGSYRPVSYTGAQVLAQRFDAARHVEELTVRVTKPGAVLAIRLAAGQEATPAAPGGLHLDSAGATDVALAWNAPAAPGAAATVVLRDGTPIGLVPPATTAFVDHSAKPATTYTYALAALGVDGRRSVAGPSVQVTTKRILTFTFTATADTYVDQARPGTVYGGASTLRVAGSPIVVAYLRFDVTGLQGRIRSATLRTHTNHGGAGFDVHATTPDWDETHTSYSTAPPYSNPTIGSSGPLAKDSSSNVLITPLVTGDGSVNIALAATDPTSGVNLASREAGAGTAPQLVVETEA